MRLDTLKNYFFDQRLICIGFEYERQRRLKSMHMEGSPMSQLVRSDGGKTASAGSTGQTLEGGIFEDIGSQPVFQRQAAGAENAEIRVYRFQLSYRGQIDRRPDGRLHPSANHDQLDPRSTREFGGDCRRVGDRSQAKILGEAAGDGKICRTCIEKNDTALLHKFHDLQAQRLLAIRLLEDTRSQRNGLSAWQQCATINPLAFPAPGHFPQVTPHRIFRDAERQCKILRRDAPLGTQLL